MRVKYTDQSVKWENNGETIEIHIENIIFADFDKDKNVIFIGVGKNFIASDFYYYSIDGLLILQYHESTDIISWGYNKKHEIEIPNKESVSFYPNQKLILVIYRISSEQTSVTEMKILDLYGNLIYQVKSPEGYNMIYVTDVLSNQIKVVCDAVIEENRDSYGRDCFHFLLDLDTGKWTKLGLAY